MRLRVHHVSHYRYDRPVRGIVQSHRLTPASFDGQRVLGWSVSVSGGVPGGSFRDGAGDKVQGWTVPGPVQEVEVTVTGEVETTDMAGVLRGLRETIPPEVYLPETAATRPDAALRAMAEAVTASGDLPLAHALAVATAEAITWRPGTTDACTSAAEALAAGKGVCQDHAQVLIALARLWRLPARYVTGYLCATPEDEAAHEAAHAWAEIWIAGLGWVGFDPANRCCPDDRYIRLGSGRDAAEAAPIRGIARSGQGEAATEALDVRVAIEDAVQQ